MKLKNMYMLDLSRNEFYGTIPEDITQENFSTLRLLYMDHNLLTGTIPGSLMQMRKMKGLFLNDNRKYDAAKHAPVKQVIDIAHCTLHFLLSPHPDTGSNFISLQQSSRV